MTDNRNKKRGFTLIETLVAVMLLTSAIAGPITIAARGLLGALVARDQITAFYLAQDAMEYVRFVRDSNMLVGSAWLAGLGACTSTDSSATCYVDSIQGTAAACGGSCPVLQYDASNYFFSYTTGTPVPQKFTRIVSITTPVGTNDCQGTNGCEAAVSVVVTWSDRGGITRSITVRENLLRWQ